MSLYNSLMEMVLDETFLIGRKINPKQQMAETLKKHSYPGYLVMIKAAKDDNDIKYISNDIDIMLNTLKTLKGELEKCYKLGDCPETKFFYNFNKKNYMDKGITAKDCDETIKWFSTVAKQELNKRAKELGK